MAHWELNREFSFEGRRVRYDARGSGPAVVMVHGTPWSSFNLRHLINVLSKDFRVYYFDLLGYGQSDKSPGDVSLGLQNRLLAELLDHWQLKRPLVIGHDFGGTTVLRSHLVSGCAYEKMVVIDPVALSPWGSPFFKHVNRHEDAFAGVPDYIHDAIVRAYVKTAAFTPIDEATLDRIAAPWTGRDGKAAFYRQIAQADSAFTDEIQPLYNTMGIPVLILWGKEDAWIPVEKGEQLHGLIPGSRFGVIPDAGHLVIEEQPGRLLKEIRAFFEQ